MSTLKKMLILFQINDFINFPIKQIIKYIFQLKFYFIFSIMH